jgi:hypothetical protein
MLGAERRAQAAPAEQPRPIANLAGSVLWSCLIRLPRRDDFGDCIGCELRARRGWRVAHKTPSISRSFVLVVADLRAIAAKNNPDLRHTNLPQERNRAEEVAVMEERLGLTHAPLVGVRL